VKDDAASKELLDKKTKVNIFDPNESVESKSSQTF
jgi:hypothetical protein